MVTDKDIWRAATRLIDRYGEDAAFHAGQRVDDMLEVDDMDGRQIWLRILEAVTELMKAEPDGAVL